MQMSEVSDEMKSLQQKNVLLTGASLVNRALASTLLLQPDPEMPLLWGRPHWSAAMPSGGR